MTESTFVIGITQDDKLMGGFIDLPTPDGWRVVILGEYVAKISPSGGVGITGPDQAITKSMFDRLEPLILGPQIDEATLQFIGDQMVKAILSKRPTR